MNNVHFKIILTLQSIQKHHLRCLINWKLYFSEIFINICFVPDSINITFSWKTLYLIFVFLCVFYNIGISLTQHIIGTLVQYRNNSGAIKLFKADLTAFFSKPVYCLAISDFYV